MKWSLWGIVLGAWALTLPARAQVATIVEEISALESVRDPKCYATASRLEDFIYGTPLESTARFEKIALQKALIRSVWERASGVAGTSGKTEVDVDALGPILRSLTSLTRASDGNWTVGVRQGRALLITARDVRQYGSVAYALRAILSVQQDSLTGAHPPLVPLTAESVNQLRESLDVVTLGALQLADQAARGLDRRTVSKEIFQRSWHQLVAGSSSPSPPAIATRKQPADPFATINAIIQEKLAAYEVYNKLSMPVFLRNVQVYMARHLWPTDPEEGKRFKDQFTEVMVAWTLDVLLQAESHARKTSHPLVRIEDVDAALQLFEPHEANAYEDIIFFPRLPKAEQVVIEAYDLDSFRDPGIHWLYVKEALRDSRYSGRLEPDPFAAELLAEGAAQFGVLVLRLAGSAATSDGRDRLASKDLETSLQRIQELLNKHASATQRKPPSQSIASVPGTSGSGAGTYFTDTTARSGIVFEHRLSDWLARRIRSYTVVEGDQVRLAVPPAFGGSGAAAEDIDNDGDADVLLLGGAGNALYRNDGRGRFADVTETAGLNWKRADGRPGEPRQPIIADFDNDGWQDILITYVDDDHRLYRNTGKGRFEDVTPTSGLGGKGLVGGPATAFDFDGDGLLDLFLGYFGNYLTGELPTLSRRNDNALPDKLFRNTGNFVFKDVTANSGVDNRGWAQAVGHLDFDGDGREDLICGNDFGVNAWYRNLGGGRFEDVAAQLGTDKPSYTMSIGLADLNRDGHPDVYISNIVTMDKDESYVLPDARTRMKFNPRKMANMRVVEANDLWTSTTRGGELQSYEHSHDVGPGSRSTGWAWDADFYDFDNDGDDDLYVVNGMNEYAVYSSVNPYFTDPSGSQRSIVMPVAEKEIPVLFVNSGGKLRQETSRSGAAVAGNARSVVYLDQEGDGDLDMVINYFNGPALVFRNNAEAAGGRWLKIRLIGNPARGVSRDAIGATIIADSGYQRGLWRAVLSTTGYLSVHPKEQHFGLGKAKRASITVRWPGGEVQRFSDLRTNRAYVIRQGDPKPALQPRNVTERIPELLPEDVTAVTR